MFGSRLSGGLSIFYIFECLMWFWNAVLPDRVADHLLAKVRFEREVTLCSSIVPQAPDPFISIAAFT